MWSEPIIGPFPLLSAGWDFTFPYARKIGQRIGYGEDKLMGVADEQKMAVKMDM